MGLTVFYTLRNRTPLTAPEARSLAERLRAAVRKGKVEGLSRLIDVGPNFPLAHEWVDLPHHQGGSIHVDVPPEAGFVFQVNVGADCEPLLLGLCRYPATVVYRNRLLRTPRSRNWHLRYFCKTQYASLHGWEHFLRCHRSVIESLLAARSLGLQVQIRDEGAYWPRRSTVMLRQRLGQMNGIVAAMGGALKDARDGLAVQSPIFGHPRFEHLEHKGHQELGSRLHDVVQMVRHSVQK